MFDPNKSFMSNINGWRRFGTFGCSVYQMKYKQLHGVLMFTRKWGKINKGHIKAELEKTSSKRHWNTNKTKKNETWKGKEEVIREMQKKIVVVATPEINAKHLSQLSFVVPHISFTASPPVTITPTNQLKTL